MLAVAEMLTVSSEISIQRPREARNVSQVVDKRTHESDNVYINNTSDVTNHSKIYIYKFYAKLPVPTLNWCCIET